VRSGTAGGKMRWGGGTDLLRETVCIKKRVVYARTNRKAGLRLSKQRAILRRKLQVYEEEGEETSVCE